MWVRGWYWPGTMTSSCRMLGRPVSATGPPPSSLSWTLGPSRASSPRPSPLGFLVTMVLSLSKRCQQRVSAVPVAQPAGRVEMARRPCVDKACAPGIGHGLHALGAAVNVVVAADHDGGKRQALHHHGRPAGQLLAQLPLRRIHGGPPLTPSHPLPSSPSQSTSSYRISRRPASPLSHPVPLQLHGAPGVPTRCRNTARPPPAPRPGRADPTPGRPGQQPPTRRRDPLPVAKAAPIGRNFQ